MRFLRKIFGRSPHDEAPNGLIASLIKSIEYDPHQEVAYINLIEAYEKSDKIDGAIAYLAGLVKRRPKIGNPYRYLLVAYDRKGDLDGLKKLIGFHRNNEAAHQWYLMDAYTKNDWDGAITLLSALVELHPDDEKWSRYLLSAYENKGDRDATTAGLTKLLDACPGCSVLRQYLDGYKASADIDVAKRHAAGEPPHQSNTGDSNAVRFSSRPIDGGKSEFEKNLALKRKLDEIDTKSRERKSVEHELRSRVRPLTAREKFNRIKPAGSRDGFG